MQNQSSPSSRQCCWDCRFIDLEGTTFLGRCTWFVANKKGPAKDIPPSVVDKGCKFFSRRRNSGGYR